MKFWKEFKKFVVSGSFIGVSIGVVIGGAFSDVVKSFINGIVFPALSLLFNQPKNISTFTIKGVTFNYGTFIEAIVNFIIFAFAMFIIINSMKKILLTEEDVEPTRVCPFCKTTINAEAIRCPNCTSELPELTEEEKEAMKQTNVTEKVIGKIAEKLPRKK